MKLKGVNFGRIDEIEVSSISNVRSFHSPEKGKPNESSKTPVLKNPPIEININHPKQQVEFSTFPFVSCLHPLFSHPLFLFLTLFLPHFLISLLNLSEFLDLASFLFSLPIIESLEQINYLINFVLISLGNLETLLAEYRQRHSMITKEDVYNLTLQMLIGLLSIVENTHETSTIIST